MLNGLISKKKKSAAQAGKIAAQMDGGRCLLKISLYITTLKSKRVDIESYHEFSHSKGVSSCFIKALKDILASW